MNDKEERVECVESEEVFDVRNLSGGLKKKAKALGHGPNICWPSITKKKIGDPRSVMVVD